MLQEYVFHDKSAMTIMPLFDHVFQQCDFIWGYVSDWDEPTDVL